MHEKLSLGALWALQNSTYRIPGTERESSQQKETLAKVLFEQKNKKTLIRKTRGADFISTDEKIFVEVKSGVFTQHQMNDIKKALRTKDNEFYLQIVQEHYVLTFKLISYAMLSNPIK